MANSDIKSKIDKLEKNLKKSNIPDPKEAVRITEMLFLPQYVTGTEKEIETWKRKTFVDSRGVYLSDKWSTKMGTKEWNRYCSKLMDRLSKNRNKILINPATFGTLLASTMRKDGEIGSKLL